MMPPQTDQRLGEEPGSSPPPHKKRRAARPRRRVKTPTVLQMEAVECGAAALGIVLGYFERFVTLETLRVECGVSRDGSKASNILRAARRYGLEAKGYHKELEELSDISLPAILFWNFDHFLVLEGFGRGKVYLNDPATGPRLTTEQELDESFTGVVMTFKKGPDFSKGGTKPGILPALYRRLAGSEIPLLYAVIAGLALIVPGLAIPAFTRVFVDDVLIQGMNDWLKPLLLGMAITAVLRAGTVWLQQHCLLRLQARMSLSTSAQFFWHVLRLPMQFFTQRFPGEIGARVQSNERVAQLLSIDLATTIISLFSLVFYAAVMAAYDVVLTAVAVTFAGINLVGLRYVARKRRDLSRKILRARFQTMATSMGGIQMIESLKATGTDSEFFTSWAGRYAKWMNAESESAPYTVYLQSLPTLLSALNTAVVLGLGGMRVMDGHLSIGMLVAFQSLMASFSEPTRQLVNLASTLQDVEGDMAQLDDVLRYNADPSVPTVAEDVGVQETRVRLKGRVELKDLTFGYSRLEPPLIQGFSLTLKPGARVALVGGSGSGKSTVAKLICGLYEPWEGEILFDGQRRSEIPRWLLANSLGLVDQDIFLFGRTIRESLSMWDNTVQEESLVQATRDAAIHAEIALRQDGLDGRLDEGGLNFSGGQRQRLEIARALVWNPSILVLDEATSALDAVTEKEVDDALRRRGCTCIIVAHRLSTIRDADEIVVLEAGKVVQRGTHEEMKDVAGPYARLIES